MSGSALYVRRFMARQYTALAQQLPFGRYLLLLQGKWGSYGLLTPAEVEFLRKTKDTDTEGGKVIFTTTAPRNALRGLGSALWNVGVATFCAPIVGLSMLPHQIHQRGFVVGIIPGIVVMQVWAVAFAALGYAAALQQLLFGCYHQLAAPYHFCISGKQWNLYLGRFVHPKSTGDFEGMEVEPTSAHLRHVAMRRVARTKNSREKRDASYASKSKSSTPERTLYEVLGVTADATDKEIKEAYNKMALKYHPDRNPSKDAHDQFDAITKAYRTLSNAEKRKKYDVAGQDGVDDLGEKKREGVRGLFGGDQLQKLVGDVRVGSFSMRVIDGLDYTAQELAVVWMRMMVTSRDTLREFLAGYSAVPSPQEGLKGSASATAHTRVAAVVSESRGASGSWNQEVRGRVHRFVNTGLAKEVMYVVGQEYLAMCRVAESGPSARLCLAVTEVFPRRVRVRVDQVRVLLRARPSVMSDTALLVDLAWFLSVSELAYTARFAAWSLLGDPLIDAAERQRRLEALKALGEFFVASGKPYRGASKATVDQLMDSLRAYQAAKSRGASSA